MSDKDGFKVCVIGGTSVGKTAIIKRFVEDTFSAKSKATTTAQYTEKMVDVMGSPQPLKFLLWDTAGSERFLAMNKIYYRDAVAVLVVYDVTNKKTLYGDAEHYVQDVKENAPANCIMALVGNKSDLFSKSEVTL